jgi:hypothetical protein
MEKATSPISKRLRFLNENIVKISSPDADFVDQIIRCLSAAFVVKPTSAIMFNNELRQFFIFVSVAPKEA